MKKLLAVIIVAVVSFGLMSDRAEAVTTSGAPIGSFNFDACVVSPLSDPASNVLIFNDFICTVTASAGNMVTEVAAGHAVQLFPQPANVLFRTSTLTAMVDSFVATLTPLLYFLEYEGRLRVGDTGPTFAFLAQFVWSPFSGEISGSTKVYPSAIPLPATLLLLLAALGGLGLATRRRWPPPAAA